MLSYICAKLFFGRVVVKNQHKIPLKGPLIFVANHKNMILDPGMVRYSCKRNLYYLAKHTLFENKLIGWIFKNANAIPVYRRQDDPNLVSKNFETFNEAYNLFEKGRCLIIFPEGVSLAGRAILKIKTGAARIALNAELKNKFSLGIKIVPVGINYSEPSRLKSEVYVQYGNPISIKDFKEQSAKDIKVAVSDITNRIEESLLRLTTNLTFIEFEDTISYLEIIYKNELFLINPLGRKRKHDDFSITKEMIDAVEWYIKNNPTEMKSYISMTSKYIRYLEKLKLDDRFIISKDDSLPKLLPEKPLKVFWFLFQFPIYLYGLINNFLPYNISIAELSTKNIDEVEVAQYKFFIGLSVFSIFYIFQISLFYYFINNFYYSLIYSLLLIPSGNFALGYHDKIISYLKQFRLFRIFLKRSDIIYDLQEQRREIIELISTAMEEYKEIK